MLAPRHPLPDLGQSLWELGGEEGVGVDGGELREQRLVVGHEPGSEKNCDVTLKHILYTRRILYKGRLKNLTS